MTDKNLNHMNYLIRCLVGIGSILFGLSLINGPSDPSGIPVILGALAIAAGGLILIVSLVTWGFFAVKRADTNADDPTHGRPDNTTEQHPEFSKINVWQIIRKIIYWWW